MKNTLLYVTFLVILVVLMGVSATAELENMTTDDPPAEPIDLNITIPPEEPAVNDTLPEEIPEEEPEEEPEEIIPDVTDYDIIGVDPEKTEKGDVLLTITVENTGNTEVYNLVPIIVARGFSTYDTTPIKTLKVGKTGVMFVNGNFAQEGDVLLTIKIDDKVFYNKIKVTAPATAVEDPAVKKAEEAAKQAELDRLTEQVNEMQNNYEALLADYRTKKDKYVLTDVSLDDLKKYIISAQTAIVSGEIDKVKMAMVQAQSEYNDQQDRLDNAEKKSKLSVVKDNVVVISAIAGAFVTIFAFYEIIKKKKESVYQTIKEIKVNKNTKVTIEDKTAENANKKKKEKIPGDKAKGGRKKKAPKADQESKEEAPKKEDKKD